MGNSCIPWGVKGKISSYNQVVEDQYYQHRIKEDETRTETARKFEAQHVAIQKLTTMINRLEQSYGYYKEQCLMNKAKAIAYHEEGHDTLKAMQFVRESQHYHQAMETIMGLQNILHDIQIKLRLAVETHQTMDIIKNETETLRSELDKIYHETKIMQTLNTLESQMDKVKTLQDAVQVAATNIQKKNEEDLLKTWCTHRYELLKEIQPHVEASNTTSNYYQELWRTEQHQQLPIGTQIMGMVESFFRTEDELSSTASTPPKKQPTAATATTKDSRIEYV